MLLFTSHFRRTTSPPRRNTESSTTCVDNIIDMDKGMDKYKDEDKGKDVAAVRREGVKEGEGKRTGGREQRLNRWV